MNPPPSQVAPTTPIPVVPRQRPSSAPVRASSGHGAAPQPHQQVGPVGPTRGHRAHPPTLPPSPPASTRRGTNPWWIVAALVVGVVLAASVTWAIARTDSTGPTSIAAPATLTPVVTKTDQQVCGDLDRVGGAFYSGYYKQLMLSGGHGDAVPVQLAAQTMALTTVGAPAGQIDGTAAISQASPAIRTAMSGMVRDAALVGKGAADSSVGGMNHVPDMTSLLTTFTDSTIECTKAGYQPSWFNPQELAG